MAIKTRKSKADSSRKALTAREKMLMRKEALLKKGGGGDLVFLKEASTRLRIKSPGEHEEIGIEIIQFFISKEHGSVISPATFDEPCPFLETYKKYKESNDETEKEMAGEIVPKRKFVIGGIAYKDTKGKQIDPEKVDKAFLVPKSVYQDIVDLWLDEDDYGDMTDSRNGYDIKINKSGSGLETDYSVVPCPKSRLDKEYQGTIDIESIVRKQIKSYEELEEILSKKLNNSEDDEDERPRKKTSKKLVAKPKKVKKTRDI